MRLSAIILLGLSLLSGLLTLVILGGGGYALWHTHSEVRRYEKQQEDDKKEGDQLLRRGKLTPEETQRLRELGLRESTTVEKANEADKYRSYALGGVLTFIIPAVMTVAFFTMFLVSWLKGRAAAAKAAEEEDEAAEETPTDQKKPAAKKKTQVDDS